MKPKAYELTQVCDQYLGVPYSQMDCQAFVEKCLADIGIRVDLAGSNAWFRECTWTGSPEECKSKFGEIPKGAFLFIWANDGGEEKRGYHDGKGNASHMGIYTGRGKGAIASSQSRGCVAESQFDGYSISGGWNRVGLWNRLSYGDYIDNKLNGGDVPVIKAQVDAATGKTVNMRRNPNLNSDVIKQIDIGEIVDILEQNGEWDKIEYNGQSGYMMAKYLVPVGEEGGEVPDEPPIEAPGQPIEGDYAVLKIPFDMAVELYQILDEAVGRG